MDPNETLKRLRELVSDVNFHVDNVTELDADPPEPIAVGMAGLFQALDEWLMRGGFPPDAWHPMYALKSAGGDPRIDRSDPVQRDAEDERIALWDAWDDDEEDES